MAYPASIDPLTPNPTPTSKRNNPSLAGKINAVDAVAVALQTKVGVNGSADTNSLDYKVTANAAAAVTNAANIVTTAGWLFGSGVPGGGTGANGNTYTDTATGIIYRKTAGTWSAIYTPAAGGSVIQDPTALVYGLTATTLDQAYCTTDQAMTSGTLFVGRVYLPAGTITNVHMITPFWTSGQAYGALYNGAGTLLRQSSVVNFLSPAVSTRINFVLTTPVVVTAGIYYIASWAVGGNLNVKAAQGTTTSDGAFNAGLTTATSRFATADTGLTTTAPASMGAKTAATSGKWFGCS